MRPPRQNEGQFSTLKCLIMEGANRLQTHQAHYDGTACASGVGWDGAQTQAPVSFWRTQIIPTRLTTTRRHSREATSSRLCDELGVGSDSNDLRFRRHRACSFRSCSRMGMCQLMALPSLIRGSDAIVDNGLFAVAPSQPRDGLFPI